MKKNVLLLVVLILLQSNHLIHSLGLLSKYKSILLPIAGFYTAMNLPIYGIGLLSSSDVAGGLGSMTDFSIVRNRLPAGMTANEYIICPPGTTTSHSLDSIIFHTITWYIGVCPNAQVIKSPEFNVDIKQLEKAVDKVILNSDLRTSFIQEDKATNRREYVQRMRLLNWPDVITVQFFGDEKKSTLAMHSYSIYGGSDLGVNRNRVREWLVNIDKELKQ